MKHRNLKPLDGQRDKTASFYETEASLYDRRWFSKAGSWMDQRQRTIVRDLVGNCQGKRVLEIGPGTGRFSVELARVGATLFLADIASNMLCVARQKLEKHGLFEQGQLVQSGIDELSFPADTFDLVVIINVFSHLENPVSSLSEVARVLRPRGVLIVNYPNILSLYFPIGLAANLRRRAILHNVYSHWYNIFEIYKIHSPIGLKPQRIVGHVHFPNSWGNGVILSILTRLDRVSSTSLLRFFAPTLFVQSVKTTE